MDERGVPFPEPHRSSCDCSTCSGLDPHEALQCFKQRENMWQQSLERLERRDEANTRLVHELLASQKRMEDFQGVILKEVVATLTALGSEQKRQREDYNRLILVTEGMAKRIDTDALKKLKRESSLDEEIAAGQKRDAAQRKAQGK